MSTLPFNARFIPTNSSQLSPTTWNVDGNLFDGLGLFSAFDVQVNDAIYLDCFNSFSFPGTVNRYKVLTIHSRTGLQINFDLQWDDSGDVVDIGEVVGSAGFICRPTLNKSMAFHAAPTVHNIPDYVVQYSRNIDSINIVDTYGYKSVKNMTGSTIAQYRVVAWNDNGTVALADATMHGLSDVAGITLQPILNGQFGYIIKRGYLPNAIASLGAIPGADNIVANKPRNDDNNTYFRSDCQYHHYRTSRTTIRHRVFKRHRFGHGIGYTTGDMIMTTAKRRVKSNKTEKTELNMVQLLKDNPNFEKVLGELTKEFSEKVQDLVKDSNIEALVKVSFSFSLAEGETTHGSTKHIRL